MQTPDLTTDALQKTAKLLADLELKRSDLAAHPTVKDKEEGLKRLDAAIASARRVLRLLQPGRESETT